MLAPFVTAGATEPDGRDCYALVDGDHTGIEKRAGRLLAYRDEKVIGGSDTWADAFGAMMATLNRRVIDDYTGYALHAGVVATEGRAIAFPADSGGGKSTLTAACLQAGFDYVSDEALCIDADSGFVELYPKPLGLSQWSRQRLGIDEGSLVFPAGTGEAMVTPADVGASIAASPIELSHIVIPTFGAGAPVLTKAPGRVAMATLIEFSFNHYKHQERAFTLAAELANRVDVWRLEYDDPVAAAQLVRTHLA